MMKLLLLVAVIFVLSASQSLLAADDHNGQTNGGERISAEQRQARIFDYINACLAGRPVGASSTVSEIKLDPPQTTPTAGNGEAIFKSKCLSCHNGASGPPNLTLLNSSSASKSAQQVASGNMPKNGSLSAEEKSALLQYLNSKK